MVRHEHNVIAQKGKFISAGLSGIVELLSSGLISKSPHPGALLGPDSRIEIANEAKIYAHLGPEPGLIRMESYTEGVLLLQYMPNGNLKDYLRAHSNTISMSQRLQWACEAADRVRLLHSRDVIHCDIKPENFLLDAELCLRIVDFASSSLKGSRVLECRTTRFSLPRGPREQPTARSDIFSLGSTIYMIMTGKGPFEELDSDEVARSYKSEVFPSCTGTSCDEFIQWCWRGKFTSAQEAYDHITALVILYSHDPLISELLSD